MEKAGLIKCLDTLQEADLDVAHCQFVTDRHLGIAKYLRETRPDIQHCYDIWHVAKCKLKSLFM